jgi:protein gp37
VADTSIEWATKVWNPTRGCRRVSLGCGGAGRVGGCYAERQAHRFSGPGGTYEGLTRMTENGPRWTGATRFVPELLDEPLRWRKSQRVFVDSMSDLFYEGFTDEQIAAVFGVMAAAHRHTFLILTKRAARMREWFVGRASALPCVKEARRHDVEIGWPVVDGVGVLDDVWPLPNVHLGVSVEDQATADERIAHLLQTPAAVRWVSYEPALGPVDFKRYMPEPLFHCSECGRELRASWCQRCRRATSDTASNVLRGLDWIVVGGESGPGARPFQIEWARSTVEQCRAAGVPAFCKQVGACPTVDADEPHWPGTQRTGDGHGRYYLHLKSRKGGDMSEWSEDLRVREFPNVR